MRQLLVVSVVLLVTSLVAGCIGTIGPWDMEELETMSLDDLEQMAREMEPDEVELPEAFFGRTGSGAIGTMSLLVEGATGGLDQQDVPYEVIDGVRVMDGDILVPDGSPADLEPGDYQTMAMTMTAAKSWRWPDGIIPYDRKSLQAYGYSFATMMIAAMRRWNEATGGAVKFVERKSQKSYIYFTRKNGCSSYVGRIGKPQAVNMAAGCGFRAAVHELGHALGLKHEHQRLDRDSYITVLWNNIPSKWQKWFKKVPWGSAKTTYDVGSIMHYTSVSSQKPWVLTRGGKTIFNNGHITTRDAAAIRYLYGVTSGSSSGSVTCPPAGTTFNTPPQLGNLAGRSCSYACWGKGTLYNACGVSRWQFCLPSGAFASCQVR